MPPKKTKTVKKKAIRTSDESDIQFGQLDVQYNPDIVDNLLCELEKQIEMKCAQIMNDTEFLITSIQQAFHLELIKLPNQVKSMSVKRFREEFGDSLEAVTRGAIGGLKPITTGNKVTNNSNNNSANSRASINVFQTPMNHGNKLTIQARNPKEGEVILSANGSPLGEFSTVKKAPKPMDGHSFVPPTPGIYVPLKTGEVVDIDELDIENMTEETKRDALDKMQAVMNNMQLMMSKLSQI